MFNGECRKFQNYVNVTFLKLDGIRNLHKSELTPPPPFLCLIGYAYVLNNESQQLKMLFLPGFSHETHKRSTLNNYIIIYYYIMNTVLNKQIFFNQKILNKFNIKQPGNCLNRSDDIFISSIEQTEAEKGISPKWFYTEKPNFWIPQNIFEYE